MNNYFVYVAPDSNNHIPQTICPLSEQISDSYSICLLVNVLICESMSAGLVVQVKVPGCVSEHVYGCVKCLPAFVHVLVC